MDFDTYNGLKLMQQNSDEQMQQQFQSQGIIMSGGEQSQQEVIVQDDQAQQHVVYSPMKPNDSNQQYITQEDSMQNQYLIQSPAPQQGQVYYNISPQNQNRIQQQQHQTIALNHNIIQQNQNQQKVSKFLFVWPFYNIFVDSWYFRPQKSLCNEILTCFKRQRTWHRSSIIKTNKQYSITLRHRWTRVKGNSSSLSNRLRKSSRRSIRNSRAR